MRNSVAVQFGKSSWQKYGLRRRNSPRASRIRKGGSKELTLPTSHNLEGDTITASTLAQIRLTTHNDSLTSSDCGGQLILPLMKRLPHSHLPPFFVPPVFDYLLS